MLISLIKFIHLLVALSLLVSVIFCLGYASRQSFSFSQAYQINRGMLWLSLIAMITGALLVYPFHFTFHTPWIIAAFSFVFIFSSLLGLFQFLKNKLPQKAWWCGYLLLLILLMVVVHDAVTKVTFFPTL